MKQNDVVTVKNFDDFKVMSGYAQTQPALPVAKLQSMAPCAPL
jgi:hypothetical protein